MLCNNVMHRLPADPLALSSGAGARLALAAVVAAAFGRASPGRCCRREPPEILVSDLTVCHARRPAVHHLSGASRRAASPPWSGRTVPANPPCCARWPVCIGRSRADRRCRADRLAAAAIVHRPGLPAVLPGRRAVRLCGRRRGRSAPCGGTRWARAEAALAAVGLRGFERRPVGGVSRASSSGCSSRGCCSRTRPCAAGRALQRGGRPHRRRPAGDGAALARRRPHGRRRAARPDWCGTSSPKP
jgi:hypothetical protein